MSEVITHKERTRQRIQEEAASIRRIVGAEGIGVAALMKRAGLTPRVGCPFTAGNGLCRAGVAGLLRTG